MGTSTATAYYGVTGSNGKNGSNQQHAVKDADTWTSYCGKAVAEAWAYAPEHATSTITCTACLRALAKAAR